MICITITISSPYIIGSTTSEFSIFSDYDIAISSTNFTATKNPATTTIPSVLIVIVGDMLKTGLCRAISEPGISIDVDVTHGKNTATTAVKIVKSTIRPWNIFDMVSLKFG